MKIILSRKGFDSSRGGYPSPILPSDKLCSLPIPESERHSCSRRYDQVMFGDSSLGEVVEDLTDMTVAANETVHLDPDLNHSSIPRDPGWNPVFGQALASEAHLRNQGVEAGDVFLFFGWFRHAERVDGRYRYVQGSPDLHIIFGWLQIEERIRLDLGDEKPSWALDHPHCSFGADVRPNSIYTSKERLALDDYALDMPGAGLFRNYRQDLCLTEVKEQVADTKRSTWRLPTWFDPACRKPGLTYHGSPDRWHFEDDFVRLRSAGRGQEFVLDCDYYPESVEWLAQLLSLSN